MVSPMIRAPPVVRQRIPARIPLQYALIALHSLVSGRARRAAIPNNGKSAGATNTHALRFKTSDRLKEKAHES